MRPRSSRIGQLCFDSGLKTRCISLRRRHDPVRALDKLFMVRTIGNTSSKARLFLVAQDPRAIGIAAARASLTVLSFLAPRLRMCFRIVRRDGIRHCAASKRYFCSMRMLRPR